jgi:hypothetical protein
LARSRFSPSLLMLTVAFVGFHVAIICADPSVFDLDNIEPRLYDADHSVVYRLSLEIQGLIVGLPQLLVALGGGVITTAIARKRREWDRPRRSGRPVSATSHRTARADGWRGSSPMKARAFIRRHGRPAAEEIVDERLNIADHTPLGTNAGTGDI